MKLRKISPLCFTAFIITFSLVIGIVFAPYEPWTLLDSDDFESGYEDWIAYNTFNVETWTKRIAEVPYHGSYVMRTTPEINQGDDEIGDVGMTKNFTIPSEGDSLRFTGYIRSWIYRDGSEAGIYGSFISVDGVIYWDNFLESPAIAPNLGTNLTFWYWQEVQILISGEANQTVTIRIGSRYWQEQPTTGLNEPKVLLDWVNVYWSDYIPAAESISGNIELAAVMMASFWFIVFCCHVFYVVDTGKSEYFVQLLIGYTVATVLILILAAAILTI